MIKREKYQYFFISRSNQYNFVSNFRWISLKTAPTWRSSSIPSIQHFSKRQKSRQIVFNCQPFSIFHIHNKKVHLNLTSLLLFCALFAHSIWLSFHNFLAQMHQVFALSIKRQEKKNWDASILLFRYLYSFCLNIIKNGRAQEIVLLFFRMAKRLAFYI